jgi:hypothetical protein
MARKELRHCTIKVRDGLGGQALVNQMMTAPMANDTSLTIDAVALNTPTITKVPVGARFTIAGETIATTVHTVTARTPTSAGPTTAITFTPALGAGTYLDNGIITFQPQEISIKLGDGDVKWTEKNEFTYDLDRGNLDGVRKANEVPMDVSFNFIFDHVVSASGEPITPMEAIKGVGAASEWVTSATDKCEPYAVDIVVIDNPPCAPANAETMTFPDFRSESREGSFKDASISISGRCNAQEPLVERPS